MTYTGGSFEERVLNKLEQIHQAFGSATSEAMITNSGSAQTNILDKLEQIRQALRPGEV